MQRVLSQVKNAAATPAPVDIDYDRIIDGVTNNIADYIETRIDAAITAARPPADYGQIAKHVTAAVNTAMKSYLANPDPLPEFMQTCAKLKSKDEEKANKNRKLVESLVEQLGKKGKKNEVHEEETELTEVKSSVVKKRTKKNSLDPDDLFGGGMGPDDDTGEVDFSVEG